MQSTCELKTRRFCKGLLSLLGTLRLLVLGSLLTIAGQVVAANVYVMSSGDAPTDDAVVARLRGFGHNVTLGVQYTAFDGTQSLAGIDVVYLQANSNWYVGDMPVAGQTALLNFINAGGGLVTCEWVIWKAVAQGAYATLNPAFPVVPTSSYNHNSTGTYNQVTADPILNAGLPASFTFPIDNYAGTETNFAAARSGATVFYNSTVGGTRLGVLGWQYGSGRVLNFSTTNGPNQVNNANFGRLLSNAMDWAATTTPGCNVEINLENFADDSVLNGQSVAYYVNGAGPHTATWNNGNILVNAAAGDVLCVKVPGWCSVSAEISECPGSMDVPASQAGDFDGDGAVTSSDVDAVFTLFINFGYDVKADVNGDGAVDSTDVDLVFTNFLNFAADQCP